MQRSPRPSPQASFGRLRALATQLALAVALPALCWAQSARAQDSSGPASTDPLAQRSGEAQGVPAIAAPAPAATSDGEQPINFEADTIEYGNDTEVVTARGNVILVRGNQSVRADTVVWNRKTGQVVATGNVRGVDQDGNLLLTERVELTDELKAGVIQNMLIVLREGGRIAADKGTRNADGTITLEHASYTACAVETSKGCPKTPSWRINAEQVVYDPQREHVRYKGARLLVFGVPIPLPLLEHSTNGTAQSGLLAPDLSYNQSNGVEFAQGYYFALGPNRDLTTTFHAYTQSLPMLEATYRELNDLGAFQVTGYATRSSKFLTGAASAQQDFRGAVDANGHFQLSPNWGLTISTRLASDRTFLRRYEISRDDRLRSTINLERIDTDSYFSLAGWATQTLRIGDPQGQVPLALPVLDYRRRLVPPLIGGKLELEVNSLAITRSAGQDTQRAFTKAQWDLRRIVLGGVEATLTGLLRGDVYHSDANDLTATAVYRGNPGWETRGIALGAIDIKYPLAGALLGGNQVLTPRFQVVATPAIKNLAIPNEDSRAIDLEDSNLFALNRFPGYDRVEDGTRFTYGFDWLYERPSWRISATVGQSYRLSTKPTIFPDGTGLTSRTSDVVGRYQIRFRDLVSLTHRFRLDKDSLAVRRNELDATVGSYKTYLEVGYLRLNRNITTVEDLQDREELRLSARVAFARYWSVFGSTVVDLTNKKEDPTFLSDGFDPLRTRLGVAYSDECLEMSLTWRRDFVATGDARRGNTFMVRFALKNIGFR